MGLRFRKSINLGGGFRINLSQSGVGYSWGVPGFRMTQTASGKTRTTCSIPGTGISYVSENNNKSKGTRPKIPTQHERLYIEAAEPADYEILPDNNENTHQYSRPKMQISHDNLKSIHKSADEAVDWTEILLSPTPTDNIYDENLWRYCHSVASKILHGDIDTYLQVIQDLNPYDDLLDFGGDFEFGTDKSSEMTVQFTAKTRELMPPMGSISTCDYYDLMQDYVCSVAIRTARDTFALLPVRTVFINAVDDGYTILSVMFEREKFSKIKFTMADPSNIIEKFTHNMHFSLQTGFSPVEELR